MRKRCTDALEYLRDDKGQTLAELPLVIVLTCILVLLLIQPVVHLYTKMVLGKVAADLTRVAATEGQTIAGSKEVLLKAYAADKLEGLPKGSAFCVPGSLKIKVSGDARSSRVSAEVSVAQQPLPLIGLLYGAGVGGNVEVVGRAETRGAWCEVEGSPKDAPQVFGAVDL